MKQPSCFTWLKTPNPRRAFVFAWSWHALSALGLALPLASLLHAWVSDLPGAERSLLNPGGYLLGEVLRLGGPALDAAFQLTAIGFVVAALARVIPLTALVVALNHPKRLSLANFARRCVLALPQQTKLTLASALAWLVCITCGLFAASLVASVIAPTDNNRTLDLVQIALKCVFLAPCLLIQPITDLSRFSSRPGVRSLGSQLIRGVETFTWKPTNILRSYFLPQIYGYAFTATAAYAAYQIEVSGSAAYRDWLAAALHLIALAALLTARVCWLSRAEQWTKLFLDPNKHR